MAEGLRTGTLAPRWSKRQCPGKWRPSSTYPRGQGVHVIEGDRPCPPVMHMGKQNPVHPPHRIHQPSKGRPARATHTEHKMRHPDRLYVHSSAALSPLTLPCDRDHCRLQNSPCKTETLSPYARTAPPRPLSPWHPLLCFLSALDGIFVGAEWTGGILAGAMQMCTAFSF